MRRRWCRRPETHRTYFGNGSGPLSSLVLLSSFCRWAGLESVQPLVPPSRDSWNSSDFSNEPALLASGIGLQIFRAGTHSRRALGVWRRARNRATRTVFIDLQADDHRICDSSRSCDPTTPGGSPHHVTGSQRDMTYLITKTFCAKTCQQRRTFEMRQLPHVPYN